MFCIPLNSATDRSLAGGKAAGLAAVQDLGFKVPPTVVVSTATLRSFLESNSLLELVTKYLSSPPDDGSFAMLRERFMAGTLPEALSAEIREAAATLLANSTAGLAVRSSYVEEDSAAASFAGVFESYVGLGTPEAALAAVVECWLSGFAPRALRYMERAVITPRPAAMAVILQPVVEAVRSGVILTADPETGDPWRFVLHAARGLSVDLMSGSGAGDQVVADWETGEVVESTEASAEPVLSPTDARAVCGAALALDEAFGARQDIEWAIDKENQLWILQARPLTALPKLPPPLAEADQSREWQLSPYVIPMRDEVPRGFLTPLYADISMSELWYRYQPKDIIFTGIWRHERDFHGFRYVDTEVSPDFRDFLSGMEAYETWLAANEPFYRARWDSHGEELEAIRRLAVESFDAPLPTLVRAAIEARDRLWDLDSFGWSGPQALGWMCEGALQAFLRQFDKSLEVSGLLGGEESRTFEWTTALQDLAGEFATGPVRDVFERVPLDCVLDEIRSSGEIGFADAYEAVCWRFGKTPPSWKGRPSFWRTIWDDGEAARMRSIRASMREEALDARAAREASVEVRDAVTARVRETVAERGAREAERFDRLLEWTRYWTQALNDRHGLSVGLLWERELWWRVSDRLMDVGVTVVPEDVLELRASDLVEFCDSPEIESLRHVAELRRREHRRNRRYSAPIHAGTRSDAPATVADAETPQPPAAEGSILRGQPFGRGAAEGHARLLRTLDTATLDSLGPEDILVVFEENAFAYADWHSLFMSVRGVVAAGRPAHHLTQIAREVGIPVIGYVSGLERIRDGQRLRLDVASRSVELL